MRRTITYTFRLPEELRDRVASISNQLNLVSADFIRRAIDEKVARYDDEKRKKENEKLERRQTKLEGRSKERSIGNLDRSVDSLRRKPLSEAYAELDRRPNASDEKLYVELARHILTGGDDVDEIRRRAMKAVESVQRARPLTCPDESEIIAKLEEHMAALKINKNKAPGDYDRFVGIVLDTKKMKSVGEVNNEVEEQESEMNNERED